MRKIISFLIAGWWSVFVVLACPLIVLAQTKTPTDKVSATPTLSEAKKEEDTIEEIKQKVQERLNKASKRKKAYVGSLTDIADLSLKINTKEGVKIAATSGDTLFFRTEKGTQVKTKLSELPIGEWIIAMGYLGGNGNGEILEATRVISTTKPEEERRQVWWGQVDELKRSGEFLLAGIEGKSFQIKVDKKTSIQVWSGEKGEVFKDKLKEGMKVIVTGLPDKNDETILTVSLIYVVSEIQGQKVSVSPTPTPKT